MGTLMNTSLDCEFMWNANDANGGNKTLPLKTETNIHIQFSNIKNPSFFSWVDLGPLLYVRYHHLPFLAHMKLHVFYSFVAIENYKLGG